MAIADKLKLVSTNTDILFGGQLHKIEIYEADIAYDRPITKTFIQVNKFSNPAKGCHKFTDYCNYGFSQYDRPAHFSSERRYKTPTQAYKAARIHLTGK